MANIIETITLDIMDYDVDVTAENIKLDESRKSHVRKLRASFKKLEAIWKEYNKAICTLYGNKKTKDGTLTITERHYCVVDENKLVELYGADALEKVKVKPVDQIFVSSI